MTSTPRPPVVRPLAFSVEPYRIAVNEAASRVRGLWLGYLALTAYLTLAVIGVTHRDLFLETPISLPVMNVDLPLQAFFVVAPLFFLINHFYLLQQLRSLGHRVHAFNWAMGQAALDAVASRRERLGLTTYALVLLIGAGPEENKGWGGVFLWLVTVITLLLAPVVLLLVFQLQFLAYHSAPITWVHRVLLLLDVLLLCLFWPAIRSDQWPTKWTFLKSLSLYWVPIAAFSLFLATFPGEGMDGGPQVDDWVRDQDSDFASVKIALFGGRGVGEDGSPNEIARFLPFWRVLHLADRRDLIDLDRLDKIRGRRENSPSEEALATPDRPLSLPGRDFRGAHLESSDLREVNLDGANLRGAFLTYASLQGASLNDARLQSASLIGASLQGASLNDSSLQGAYFSLTDLQGASLNDASLQGASLIGAKMQGASLNDASLQGASLHRASLQGASLIGAKMQGASLNGASLQGASLNSARLQGASLNSASLQGASLVLTRLSCVILDGSAAWGVTGQPQLDRSPCGRVVKVSWTHPSQEDIADWEQRSLEGVSDAAIRDRLSAFYQELGSRLADPDFVSSPEWLHTLSMVSDIRFQDGLATLLADLFCDKSSAPYVAQGLIKHRFSAPLFVPMSYVYLPLSHLDTAHLTALSRRLLDAREGRTEDCPGVMGVEPEDIKRLPEWAVDAEK
ncbi:pentapeptide repeat-containing protein [Rhodospirillum sp. A1_3_36]|uniref:pentapeptide repeat-containing protein n=1 Tax=Rhodospirillum sp. A1_3_36 TaxID=3391666 RepID=UPI0039A4B7CB